MNPFHRRSRAAATAAAILATTVSCGGEPARADRAPGPERPLVAVSILPQAFFLEAIAGPAVEIKVLIPPGANPHAWEPTPSDIVDMNRAAIWFTIGVDFEEAWVPRFTGSCPGLRVVATVDDAQRLPIDRWGIPREFGEPGDPAEEAHGHAETGQDPHVWLSPELVRSQAAVMAGALTEEFPGDSALFAAGLASFDSGIDTLQVRIRRLLEPVAGRAFMVFHPAWGYFADEFGLVMVPVEVAGNEPSPSDLADLIDAARAAGITTVFVSPQFSTSSAEVLASEIAGVTAVLDPLAADWAGNLLEAAALIAGAGEDGSR